MSSTGRFDQRLLEGAPCAQQTQGFDGFIERPMMVPA